MLQPNAPAAQPLHRMDDGTVKQINPFSGTQVWTVPGRGNRPLGVTAPDPRPVDPERHGRHCAFCEHRYEESPPEVARVVRAGDDWHTLRHVPASQLHDTVAEFRRVPNLFEILSFDYWRLNYGYEMPDHIAAWAQAYVVTDAGRAHLEQVVRQRLRAQGVTDDDWERIPAAERMERGMGFFGSTHEVVIARRHFVDGAELDSQLASSGSLTPGEHHRYLSITVEGMRQLYEANRYARYVAAFQNWLKPAGASFDHLHKQLVAIDERGVQAELELMRARQNPNLYNEMAANYAAYHNLWIAENEHAVAFAGFGHRYPTLEVYSKSRECSPWAMAPEEVRGMSDLVHACHAATGPEVPCNEEWHHQPPDSDTPMPWRISVKWRVSTMAGFEGGTKININTIDPWTLRDKVVPRLQELRAQGRIAHAAIATECRCRPNPLRYNPRLP